MKNTALEFLKDYIYFILGGLCIVIIGVIYIVLRLQPGRQILPQDIVYVPSAIVEPVPVAEYPPVQGTSEPTEEAAEEVSTIIVHIVGEVQSPGVFELPYGSRVDDILQMAGGGTIYADLSRINLAAFLRDAMQIIIPAFGEDLEYLFVYDETYAAAQAYGVTGAGLVNINTASLTELQTLPRVGPAMAQRIIDFRETHGNFVTVDELINVPGIGDATLAGLREMVTVGR